MNTHRNQPYLENLSTQTVHMLSDTIIIGRHQDCNLVLKSERGASRKHARITIQNGNAVLMDLGSLNGTLVNGREISRAVQLADGDIVIFDEQEYRFTGVADDPQSGSDNVTVIANKDEIGRPDRIKPAIRLVETAPTPPDSAPTPSSNEAKAASLDETKAWDSLSDSLDQTQNVNDQDTGQRGPLPSESRAEYEKRQKELLTQKLQSQKVQIPESQPQQPPAHEPQIQSSSPQGPQAQESFNQQPQAQEPHNQHSQASQEPESRAQPSINPESQSPRSGPHAKEADAFEWHPDEPRAVKLPAQQQPANRQQRHQAEPPQRVQSAENRHSAQQANFHNDHDEYRPIPATSRPGGDARASRNERYRANERSTRPGLQKHSYRPEPVKKINWTRWLIVIPLIALLAIGAIYLAYNAGYSAGNTGSPNGFS